jgi:hypothetical protein
MSLLRISTTLLFLGLASPAALAGFTAAVTPPFSTSPCARFAGWEVFTQPYNGPNVPDVAGTDETSAEITQLIPGAILTSGGNIYDPFQSTAFRLTDTTTAPVREVVFETSTQGNSRNVSSFTLTYVDANGQDVVLAPTQFIPLVQLPQQHDELYFQWDLSTASVPITSYRIEWIASAPSMSFDAALLYVRLACAPPAPGSSFCAGDGSGTACPCANTGGTDRGCANSVNAAGGELAGSGSASIANDTLVLSGNGMPDSSCLYFQGSAMQGAGAGAVFGDGLRCAAGSIVRLGTAVNASGTSSYPSVTQQSVSVRGVTSSGAIRYYQVWYRNAAAFCTPSTFNLSNGYAVTWQP